MPEPLIDFRSHHHARSGDLYRIGTKVEGKRTKWSKPMGKDVAERTINLMDFGRQMFRPVTAPAVDLRAERVRKSSLAGKPVVDFRDLFGFIDRPVRPRPQPRRTASGDVRRKGVWQRPPSGYAPVESPEHEYVWNRAHTYGYSRLGGGKTLAEARASQKRARKYYSKPVIVQLGKVAPGRHNYAMYAPKAEVQARKAQWGR